MGIKNSKYSVSIKSIVTFMNRLMSCILKSESTTSSNTIYSVSRGNSGKSELKLFTNKSFHFFQVNFVPECEGQETFLHYLL